MPTQSTAIVQRSASDLASYTSVWIAIAHRHELLHADADFDLFEAHLGLRVIHP